MRLWEFSKFLLWCIYYSLFLFAYCLVLHKNENTLLNVWCSLIFICDFLPNEPELVRWCEFSPFYVAWLEARFLASCLLQFGSQLQWDIIIYKPDLICFTNQLSREYGWLIHIFFFERSCAFFSCYSFWQTPYSFQNYVYYLSPVSLVLLSATAITLGWLPSLPPQLWWLAITSWVCQ